MQSSGVGENPTSFDQGGSKNLPDASCAATCLDAQEGYRIPPDLQRTDSNRFLISRYDFSLSAASASGCEHFTPCVQASCVFTSGSDNVTPCRHCPHQGVNSCIVNLLRIERPLARTKGFIEPLFVLSTHPAFRCQLNNVEMRHEVTSHIGFAKRPCGSVDKTLSSFSQSAASIAPSMGSELR